MRVSPRVAVLVIAGVAAGAADFSAQDRLSKMPGVDHFRKMQPIITQIMPMATIFTRSESARWSRQSRISGPKIRFASNQL